MASNCKSCNAAIIWVKTVNGKLMPLDEAPVTMMLIEPSQPGIQPTARAVAVRKSHFSSCPNADQHRKARE